MAELFQTNKMEKQKIASIHERRLRQIVNLVALVTVAGLSAKFHEKDSCFPHLPATKPLFTMLLKA
jgi:hypothetical protein